jgi:hypothetical protein
VSGETTRAAIETAARDIGIVPGDPAYPFVGGMVGMLSDLERGQGAFLRDMSRRLDAAGDRLDLLIEDAKTVAGGEIANSAARELPRAIRDATLRQHRSAFLVAAAVLVGSVVVSAGCAFLLGQHTEAAQFVQTPAELQRAMTGPEAASWLNLMRINDLPRSHRSCVPDHGGEACEILLWTRLPSEKPPQ